MRVHDIDPTLRDFINVLFKRKSLVLLVFVAAVVSAIVANFIMLPRYEAESKIIIAGVKKPDTVMSQQVNLLRSGDVNKTQGEIIKSDPILEDVVVGLGLDDRETPPGISGKGIGLMRIISHKVSSCTLRINRFISTNLMGEEFVEEEKPTGFVEALNRLKKDKYVKVEPIKNTDVISIRAYDHDPQMAADIANAIAQSYVVFDMEQELSELLREYREKHPKVARLMNEIWAAKMKAYEPSTGDPAFSSNLKVVLAKSPLKPVSPKKILNILIACILGLIGGAGTSYLFGILDQTFDTPQQVSRFTQKDIIGTVPWISSLRGAPIRKSASDFKKKDPFTHSINSISDRIFLMAKEKGIKTVVVTSSDRGEGKSIFSINIAAALAARCDMKILIIDANFNNPSVGNILSIKGGTNLPALLTGKGDVKGSKIKVDTIPNLGIITGGKVDLSPLVLVCSDNMEDLLKKAKKDYDLVIMDCSNSRGNSEVANLAGGADLVLMVVKMHSTRKHIIKLGLDSLDIEDEKPIGIILNGRRYFIPGLVYSRV